MFSVKCEDTFLSVMKLYFVNSPYKMLRVTLTILLATTYPVTTFFKLYLSFSQNKYQRKPFIIITKEFPSTMEYKN